jgi:hypothetical protein
MHRLSRCVTLALMGGLLLPAVASSFSFRGTSSQGKALGFNASQNLRQITQFRFTWTGRCASGASYTDASSIESMRVKPFPRFRRGGDYTATFTPTYSATPALRFHVSLTVTGRLKSGGRADGTLSAQVSVLDPSARQIDTCNSGAVAWTAKLR